MHFPSGDYYVGDLCYVLPAPSPLWDQLCEGLEAGGSVTLVYQDAPIWMAYTNYGDGWYVDQQGRCYGVDSGTIGLVPVAACDPQKLATLNGLGHIITFSQGCTPQCEDGLFHIDHLTIDTRGVGTDDEA